MAIVGVATLSLCDWLSKYGGLPRHVLLGVGLANLAYAGFALSLCIRPTRSVRLIGVLVAANLAWSLICVGLLFGHRTAVTPLALLLLGGEAVYVAGLALIKGIRLAREASAQGGAAYSWKQAAIWAMFFCITRLRGRSREASMVPHA